MKIEDEFIPYEQALALKELGFDEPCFGYYTGDKKHLLIRPNMGRRNEDLNDIVCTAPLYQQAFRWFREKYGLEYSIKPVYGKKHYLKYRCNIYSNEKLLQVVKYYFPDNPYFDNREEAELKCLEKLIEICKQQNI